MSDLSTKEKANRIREERARLRLTQAQAADLVGVSRVQWGKYERAENQFSEMMCLTFEEKAGADAFYISTGLRKDAGQARLPVPTPNNLTEKERKLYNAMYATEWVEEAEKEFGKLHPAVAGVLITAIIGGMTKPSLYNLLDTLSDFDKHKTSIFKDRS